MPKQQWRTPTMVRTIERGADPANMTKEDLQIALNAAQVLLDRAAALKGWGIEYTSGIAKTSNKPYQSVNVYGSKMGQYNSSYAAIKFHPDTWDAFKTVIPFIEEEIEAFRHMWDK
jgi:hypothetical protein